VCHSVTAHGHPGLPRRCKKAVGDLSLWRHVVPGNTGAIVDLIVRLQLMDDVNQVFACMIFPMP
jgi:hypothetical protein